MLDKKIYQEILNNLSLGYILYRIIKNPQNIPIDYQVIAINPAFEKISGLKKDEIINKYLTELLTKSYNNNFAYFEFYKQGIEEENFKKIYQPFIKDDYYKVEVYSPQPDYLIAIFHPVKEKTIDNKNIFSLNKLSKDINLPGMIYRCKNDREWTMKFVSGGCYDLTGYQPRELIDNNVVSYKQLILPEYRDYLYDTWQDVIKKKEKFKAEYQISTKGGKQKWILEQGQGVYSEAGDLLYLEGFMLDITVRKKAEENLEASKDRFRVLFHESPLSYIVFDTEDIEIVSANIKAIKSYACETLSELKEHEFWSEPPYSYNDMLKWNKKAIKEGPQQFEWRSRKKNGEIFWEDVHLRQIELDGVKRLVAMSVDITERKKAEKALVKRDQELKRLVAVLNHSSDYISMIDRDGNPLYHNPASFEMLGYQKEKKEVLTIDEVHLPEDAQMVKEEAIPIAIETGNWEGENRLLSKDGNLIPVKQSIFPVKNESGEFFALATIMRDITEQKAYEEKLKYLSLYDQLTGIYNRSYFKEELERLEDSREYPISIISADIDGLKLINDTLGHEMGDRLLKKSVEILDSAIRSSDMLARVGGDEFIVLLANTAQQTGEEIVGRINSEIFQYNEGDPKTPVSISVGVATAKNNEQPLEDILKKADDAMYLNKLEKSGKVKQQIIDGLMAALKERDYVLDGHTNRVEGLTQKIAKKLDLSSTKKENLKLLAQAHDLGKVGISDQILFKEDSLTDKEWENIYQHPEIGYRIASSSPRYSKIANLILRHHEKYDGSGYPLGIAENEIPIEARVFAIADSFDAMTNQRHYNEVKSEKEAIAEIKRCSGGQFDPQLVDVFLAIKKEG